MDEHELRRGKVLLGHRKAVNTVAIAPDGKWLVSGSADKTLRIWNFPRGDLLRTIKVSGPVMDVAFSPTQDVIAIGFPHWVEIWDFGNWRLVWRLQQQKGSLIMDLPTKIAFSPNGSLLACSMAQYVRVWNIEAQSHGLKLILEHDDDVTALAFSPDGQRIASGSQDETVQVWDADTGQPQQLFEDHRDWVRALDFTSNGRTIASASDDGTLRLWDPVDGNVRCIIEHSEWYTAVAISPCGRKVLAGSIDTSVQLHDMETGSREVYSGHTGRINAVEFSQDVRYIVSGSEDGSIRIWKIHREGRTPGFTRPVLLPSSALQARYAAFHVGHQGQLQVVA